jgi:transposase
LVTDRWSAYEGYALARRQVCWAHLARPFAAMSEAAGEMGVVGVALGEQTDALFHIGHRFKRERLGRPTRARWMAPVHAEVLALLARGAELDHALRGRCREILRLADALFTFVEVEGIGPTNNAAERAIRKAVLWRKGSDGTQRLGGRPSWGASCRSWRRCVSKGERFSGIWSKRAMRGCSARWRPRCYPLRSPSHPDQVPKG